MGKAQDAAIDYERLQDISQLNIAIAAWQSVFSHPQFDRSQNDFRTAALAHAGQMYLYRYDEKKQLSDFTKGSELLRTSLKQVSGEFSELPMILFGLGFGLETYYEYTKNEEALKQAIDFFSQSISKTTIDAPYRPLYLDRLANAYRTYYSITGDIQLLQQANQCWEEALGILPENFQYYIPLLNSTLSH